ncbi:MAG: NAD(P)H-dependent oxidoreductase [Pseudomonadales bacterium]|nr:NAD(P)H-dependent oxidoreductase [Pseudomonadales bacterium]
MNIVGISGSVRADSNNSRLIALAGQCCPPQIQYTVATGLDQLPHFNPDHDPLDYPAVAAWIDLIRSADGLVISTPDYARGYPGTLKNALDWLVQTDAHIDKPFTMLSATSRSTVGRDTLIVVLETMAGIHIKDASLTTHLLGKSLSLAQLQQDQALMAELSQAMTTFYNQITSRSGHE